ncbi:uncharacterized protein EURHEDRAFT_27435 [Aspergillus ruber CBS 135680]|uniref:Uncharacterized protein n=1 Tax=Aspergillus ruber (strain CBS 135680) TaxID=1388766 RepID=A0A017SSZ6_ASPRC|nr:uncharacterized protein EURHEDRAFT_27435 [Aspergillus ruber CBS 135680]EYE99724.1 hypothetical protein EURHEDRAFT_27435 [Aspergillus ruber CBS 135680]
MRRSCIPNHYHSRAFTCSPITSITSTWPKMVRTKSPGGYLPAAGRQIAITSPRSSFGLQCGFAFVEWTSGRPSLSAGSHGRKCSLSKTFIPFITSYNVPRCSSFFCCLSETARILFSCEKYLRLGCCSLPTLNILIFQCKRSRIARHLSSLGCDRGR